MQNTEWEDVVVSNNVADTDWEDVNPVTQSVLDDRDGKIYNVPLAMDGIDAEFAIDTQHKGADKSSFFGKVMSVGEGIEEAIRSYEKGLLLHVGDVADTFLAKGYNYQDKMSLLKAAEKGDFSHWGEGLDDEAKANILSNMQKKVKWVEDLRAKNKSFWGKGAEILRPEEKMDELDKVMEGLGGATASVGESVVATMATKNPTIAAATIGTLYGAIANTQYFDKAMEAGTDVDEAIENAWVAGGIEGGIEALADRLLLGISKISSIQKITNSVLSSSVIKAAQSSIGKSAVKKIGTRHTKSIFADAIKGGLTEAGTEGLQTYSGLSWENYTGVSDYSDDEILNQTLFSAVIGGMVGAGTSTVGSSVYNKATADTNGKIKSVLKEQTPELNDQELQVMADAVQEMLFQESSSYINEMDKIVQKEKQPDVMPEGLTPEQLTAETRKLLKEKYKMSDEDINKTIQASLGIIDARNQFNEAYSIFNEGLTNAGRLAPVADAEARILAARALSVARAEGTQVKDVLDRWNLKFQQTSFSKFNQEIENRAKESGNSRLETLRQDINRLKKGVSRNASKGLRLSQFIKKMGGINDDRGDIKAMGASVGLLNKNGISLDEATQMAWDAGYIQGTERPDINQLLDLLSDDLGNKPVYSFNDNVKGDDRQYYLSLERALDEAGADINKDSLEVINQKLNDYKNSFAREDVAQYNPELDDFIPFQAGMVQQDDKLLNRTNKNKYLTDDEVIEVDKDAKNFATKVEALIKGELPKREQLMVLNRLPSAYNKIKELKGRRLFISQDIYKKIVDIPNKYNKNHNVSRERAIKLPELVADPNYILQSTSEGHEDRFVIVTNSKGKKWGTRLSVIIQPSSRDAIVSAYDENINISEEKKAGRVYYDKKKELESEVSALNAKGLTSSNTGIVSPNRENVNRTFYQSAFAGSRGAYQNGIIYLFENADASTVIHELGHFFLDDMQKFADNETTKEQLEAIYKFVGSTDGKLTREQHEYFANAFELYLLDGRAPNKVLEGVFVRFKNWLKRMLAEIKRISYVKLNPEIRKTFDQMLGGRGLDFAMQMSGAKMAEALESGIIPSHIVNRAIDLLGEGKMSRSDMDDILERLKSGELKRKDFAQELKKFETGNVKHNEALNPFDKLKYKEALSRGNFSKKDVLEKINRLLKWTEPRSQNGKLVGRFSNLKMNQQFDHIRELMNMDKAQAKEKLDDNVKLINAMIKGEETGDINSLVFDNKILSIRLNKASASILIDVYNAISDSYNLGRLTTSITGEAKKARKNRMVQETKDVLTDNGRVNWRKEQSKIKQFMNQLGTSQMSWQGLLDILSMNDKSSKTGQSKLSKELDVFDAQQKEAQGVADDGEKASKFMEKHLKGVGNAAISVSRYVNSKLDEKFTIEWSGGKKTFTKDQLLDIYMKSKDPETKKMMAEDTVLRYDESFLFEVNQVLTAEDRAIADALFEFYDDNYAKINAFYEEKYGVSLGKRAFYSPRSMDRGGINVDTGDLSSYTGFSAVKQRKAKAGAVKVKGAFQVLQDYIVNSNHWIAWSDKLIDINAIMGDVEVKNMIRSIFGENMEKRIGYEVSRMASNDKFQSKFGYGKLFNKIRSNYAIAALAAKPSLMIKQLTSFPAYWEHMSTTEFMSGLADFAVNMKEAIETLGNTTLMKTRDVNIIKDFEELSKSELFKKNANKVKLRELLMANIKLGDRGAIYMGGWALYKAELKKNLAKGMSEEKAKALALEKFERVTDETQQSGRLSQQSYWQSNPFLRAFTMFQSSQNQYLRKEINAIRGLVTGRADPKQAAKTLFIFHVLLPCFFQYASDGFEWDKEAQLRAALLGSLNGVFVLNSILERGLDIALGSADAWRATKMGLRDILPFWGSGEDLVKFFINLAEGDVDLEDYMEVIRAFGKPLGELTGVPVKYPLDVIQNFGSYADEGEYKKEVLLWLGWSPYALRDKNDE